MFETLLQQFSCSRIALFWTERSDVFPDNCWSQSEPLSRMLRWPRVTQLPSPASLFLALHWALGISPVSFIHFSLFFHNLGRPHQSQRLLIGIILSRRLTITNLHVCIWKSPRKSAQSFSSTFGGDSLCDSVRTEHTLFGFVSVPSTAILPRRLTQRMWQQVAKRVP